MAKLTTKSISIYDRILFQQCHLKCKVCGWDGGCGLQAKLKIVKGVNHDEVPDM